MESTPTPNIPANPFRVKFADGPAAGIMTTYPKEQRVVKYGPFEYEHSGKRDGDHWLYVKRPITRRARVLLTLMKAHIGNDPRLAPKSQPNRVIKRGRNDQCWCGSGRKFKKCHGSPASN